MVTLDVVLSPISKFHCYFRSGWGGGGGLACFFGKLTGFLSLLLLFTRTF